MGGVPFDLHGDDHRSIPRVDEGLAVVTALRVDALCHLHELPGQATHEGLHPHEVLAAPVQRAVVVSRLFKDPVFEFEQLRFVPVTRGHDEFVSVIDTTLVEPLVEFVELRESIEGATNHAATGHPEAEVGPLQERVRERLAHRLRLFELPAEALVVSLEPTHLITLTLCPDAHRTLDPIFELAVLLAALFHEACRRKYTMSAQVSTYPTKYRTISPRRHAVRVLWLFHQPPELEKYSIGQMSGWAVFSRNMLNY